MDLCTILLIGGLCGDPNVKPKEIHHYKEGTYRENNKKKSRVPDSSTRCGKASWYGREVAGRKTANGERFRPAGLTAASWHHQFDQRVLVTNPENGKSVVVRVNDRGPARRLNRLIDLSKGAFSQIASLGKGTTRVCIKEM